MSKRRDSRISCLFIFDIPIKFSSLHCVTCFLCRV
nr:MAG TPA: hypothetical protein [Caudoviricetes sp.]